MSKKINGIDIDFTGKRYDEIALDIIRAGKPGPWKDPAFDFSRLPKAPMEGDISPSTVYSAALQLGVSTRVAGLMSMLAGAESAYIGTAKNSSSGAEGLFQGLGKYARIAVASARLRDHLPMMSAIIKDYGLKGKNADLSFKDLYMMNWQGRYASSFPIPSDMMRGFIPASGSSYNGEHAYTIPDDCSWNDGVVLALIGLIRFGRLINDDFSWTIDIPPYVYDHRTDSAWSVEDGSNRITKFSGQTHRSNVKRSRVSLNEIKRNNSRSDSSRLGLRAALRSDGSKPAALFPITIDSEDPTLDVSEYRYGKGAVVIEQRRSTSYSNQIDSALRSRYPGAALRYGRLPNHPFECFDLLYDERLLSMTLSVLVKIAEDRMARSETALALLNSLLASYTSPKITMFEREVGTGRLRINPNFSATRKTSNGPIIYDFLISKSTAELYETIPQLLEIHLNRADLNVIATQLEYHSIATLTLGGPQSWMTLSYQGLPYPFSLLITPQTSNDPIRRDVGDRLDPAVLALYVRALEQYREGVYTIAT